MRTIDVASLTLEPQTAAHAEQMFIQLSDPAIYEYETKPLQSLEWLRERLTKLESRCSSCQTTVAASRWDSVSLTACE